MRVLKIDVQIVNIPVTIESLPIIWAYSFEPLRLALICSFQTTSIKLMETPYAITNTAINPMYGEVNKILIPSAIPTFDFFFFILTSEGS